MYAGILDSKCVLVTGATSGIGRALAHAIAALPSKPQVIGTGRRLERLDELKRSGIAAMTMDVSTDPLQLKTSLDRIVERYPQLDTVILCAGIQHEVHYDCSERVSTDNILQEIYINYTSVVLAITYLLPHFKQLAAEGKGCNVVVVTSGLGIVPGSWVPNYSATKAALHSFSLALRTSLQGTNVHVTEILPPLVESELHDPGFIAYGTTEQLSKTWMPLDEFTRQTIDGLKRGDIEIAVGAAARVFDRFEKGKAKVANKVAEGYKQGKSFNESVSV